MFIIHKYCHSLRERGKRECVRTKNQEWTFMLSTERRVHNWTFQFVQKCNFELLLHHHFALSPGQNQSFEAKQKFFSFFLCSFYSLFDFLKYWLKVVWNQWRTKWKTEASSEILSVKVMSEQTSQTTSHKRQQDNERDREAMKKDLF